MGVTVLLEVYGSWENCVGGHVLSGRAGLALCGLGRNAMLRLGTYWSLGAGLGVWSVGG